MTAAATTERNGKAEASEDIPTASLEAIPVGDIHVGRRARKDLGNLESLMESIKRLGMLQPIAILPNNQLLCGGRRLAAAKKLGWQQVPVIRIHNLEALADLYQAEHDENEERKAMLPSEKSYLIYLIHKQLAGAAKEAQRAGGRKSAEARTGKKVDKAEPIHVREIAAKRANVGAQVADMMLRIEEAAHKDKDKYGDLPEMMNDAGVKKTYRELEKRGGAPKKRVRMKKAPEAPADLKDQLGNDVPAKLRDTFADKFLFDLHGRIEAAGESLKLEELSAYASRKGRFFPFLDWGEALKKLRSAIGDFEVAKSLILAALPHAVCPKCNGELKRGQACRACRSSGYVTQSKLEELQKA